MKKLVLFLTLLCISTVSTAEIWKIGDSCSGDNYTVAAFNRKFIAAYDTSNPDSLATVIYYDRNTSFNFNDGTVTLGRNQLVNFNGVWLGYGCQATELEFFLAR